jgi:PHD/YefM family antitoxin component YafN of YafNO toxin-antitoxin module
MCIKLVWTKLKEKINIIKKQGDTYIMNRNHEEVYCYTKSHKNENSV